MNFKLNLKISSFLDLSWRIPEAINFELVPSENLGLSVRFVNIINLFIYNHVKFIIHCHKY